MALTIVALLVLCVLITRIFLYTSLRLPPGPRPLPLVGNLLTIMIRRSAAAKAKLMDEWIGKYGPLMTMWLGQQCLVMVSDADAAQAALIKAGNQFSSRSSASVLTFLRSIGFRMISTAPGDDHWRSTRKNLAAYLVSKGARLESQKAREEGVAWLLEAIGSDSKDGNAPVLMYEYLRETTCSIIFRVCFGQRGSKSTLKELSDVLDKFVKQLTFHLTDMMPFLKFFMRKPRFEELELQLRRLEKIVGPLIAERRELRVRGETSGDYIHNILTLQEQIGLSQSDLLALVTELHVGGIDTTSLSMEWTVAELMANPEIQQRLADEIIKVAGRRPVVEDDIQNLPYLQAVVQESLRKHPPLQNLVSHAPTKTVKFRGYDIPENTILRFAALRIQNDPRIWDEPEVFKPERFLSADGKFVPEIGRAQGKCRMLPFGAGRRICPGIDVALTMIHFILARLLQRFQLLPIDPQKGVDFTLDEHHPEFLHLKTPLLAIVKERKLSNPE